MADINPIIALLNYQELDMQIVKAETEIEKSEQRKSAVAAQSAVKQTKETAAAVEKQAEELIRFFEKTLAFYNENVKKIDDLQKKFKTGLSDEEYDSYKGMLKRLTDSFTKLEQTLSGYEKSIKDVLTRFAEVKAAAKKTMTEYGESRKAYEALKAEKQPQIDGLKKKMASIEKTVDKDLLNKYNVLRRDKTLPPVVKLVEKSCGGCRMELSMATISSLKQKGSIECEFCHRVVYVK